MYRIKKIDDLYFIQKRFLFWWYKVPDCGLGWNDKSMRFITGNKNPDVLQKIIDEFYN